MSAIDQLKLLVNLAHIDGEVDETESNYSGTITKANGITEGEANDLMANSYEIIIPENLSDEQRLGSIFSLLQLMKIEEKLFESEIRYCSKVGSKLEYYQGVMFELILTIKSVAMAKGDSESLKEQTSI